MFYSFECSACYLVHGDHNFGEIVLDFQEVAEFSVMNRLIRYHISHLHIEPFPLFFTYEINLFPPKLTHGYVIPRSFQMN